MNASAVEYEDSDDKEEMHYGCNFSGIVCVIDTGTLILVNKRMLWLYYICCVT